MAAAGGGHTNGTVMPLSLAQANDADNLCKDHHVPLAFWMFFMLENKEALHWRC